VGATAAGLGVVVSIMAGLIDALRMLLIGLAPLLAAVAVLGGGVWLALLVIAWRERKRRGTFMDAARALAATADPSDAEIQRLAVLRPKKILDDARTELEALYRQAIADSISDYCLTKGERRRLDRLARALDIPADAAETAEVEGFLQAHAALVGDGRLTDQEEALLTDLRGTLRVPEAAIQAQLAQSEQLRKARLAGSGELLPVETSIKLRKAESCYYYAAFTEKKKRVARTYQQDGVRYSEHALDDVKRGDMYVTSERVLLVSDGATNIRYDKIMDAAVDPEAGLLVLTVDGRKTPYYFAVSEPYVTAAYIDRLSGTA
jgi:hypothetical protein